MTYSLPAHLRPVAAAADELDEPVTVTLVGAPGMNGYPIDSPFVTRFWLPVVGPSCLAAGHVARHHSGRDVSVRDLARACGLKTALFVRTCARLERFHLGSLDVDLRAFRVLARWPRLSHRQIDQLPPHLRADYLREAIG